MFKSVLGDNIRTRLDYRDYEPNYIQVKVSEDDGIDLKLLNKRVADGVITYTDITKSLVKGKWSRIK